MNNISWRWIKAFILVAEHGSFTAAAQTSAQSKGNLSQQVTELEKTLGVQLLHRTTRSLRLTTIGEGYLERCQLALKQLDSASEWAMQATNDAKGRIRMNAVGGPIGEDLIAPLVYEFQRKHPSIQVELDFSSARIDLLTGPHDLVMRMGALADSTLIASGLHAITTKYVASPEFLEEYGHIDEPHDLKHCPLIYGSVNHWLLTRGTEQHLVHAKNGLQINNGRAMRRAALAGLGVTRLADVYIEADIHAGHLVEVLPDWSESTPLSLVCPPHRHQLTRVRMLMDWLKLQFPPAYQRLLSRH